MDRAVPPLNSLIAFEATARCGTLQRAANELGVTHGAVSRHLKQLEDWLQVRLFDRSQKRLKLTAEGRSYLKSISSAFEQIADGTEGLRRSPHPNRIRLATTDSVASCLLAPRIGAFISRFPRIGLWLLTGRQTIDFADSEADIALRMGGGTWLGLKSEPFLDDRLTPMASPAFLEKFGSLKRLEDLKHAPLIHETDPQSQWSSWLRRMGGPRIDDRGHLRLDGSHHVLQAAIDGHGVVLGREVMAKDALDSGKLIRPFTEGFVLEKAYWLAAPERSWKREKVRTFVAWLKETLKSHRVPLP